MRRTPIHAGLVIAAAAATLVGCSRLPTAPSTEAAPAPGSAPVLMGRADDPIPGPLWGDGAISTISLTVGKAAVLQAGRFTLLIHKNSLKVPATITLVQPDTSTMQVEFVVTPASANDFKVPLKLVADCSMDSPADFQNETIYWWDGLWQAASAVSVDPTARTITAQTKTLMNAMLAPRGAGAAGNTMSN